LQAQAQVHAPAPESGRQRGQRVSKPRGEERPVADVKDILRRAATQKAYVTGKSSDLRPKRDHGKYGTNW
jgi:hypothetical protein